LIKKWLKSLKNGYKINQKLHYRNLMF